MATHGRRLRGHRRSDDSHLRAGSQGFEAPADIRRRGRGGSRVQCARRRDSAASGGGRRQGGGNTDPAPGPGLRQRAASHQCSGLHGGRSWRRAAAPRPRAELRRAPHCHLGGRPLTRRHTGHQGGLGPRRGTGVHPTRHVLQPLRSGGERAAGGAVKRHPGPPSSWRAAQRAPGPPRPAGLGAHGAGLLAHPPALAQAITEGEHERPAARQGAQLRRGAPGLRRRQAHPGGLPRLEGLRARGHHLGDHVAAVPGRRWRAAGLRWRGAASRRRHRRLQSLDAVAALRRLDDLQRAARDRPSPDEARQHGPVLQALVVGAPDG
mmetsp:Transcript_65524/g.202761  ORF Transcript_65524/g.202761 Transcript_65524/m.202761 type:complete len:322 (-) Transcript_65524:1591-2556(-)